MVLNARSSNWTKILDNCKYYYQEEKQGRKERFEFPRGKWARIYGFYAFIKIDDDFIIWVHSTEQVKKPQFVCHNSEWYRLTELGKEAIKLIDCPKGKNLNDFKLAMMVKLKPVLEETVLKETGLTKEELTLSPNGMATIRL